MVDHLKDNLIAFADGAHSNKRRLSGIGVYITFKSAKVHISEAIGYQTNNVAELSAIKKVFETLCGFENQPLFIVTDSQYCIGALTKNWSLTTNHELIGGIKVLMAGFKHVRFIHVRGHRGVLGNEIADVLASCATCPPGKVVHCEKAPYDVYIGRGSKWGNPYEIGPDMAREEAIEMFEQYLDRKPGLLRQLAGIHGKVLGCHCAPKACHGDILIKRSGKAFARKLTKKLREKKDVE